MAFNLKHKFAFSHNWINAYNVNKTTNKQTKTFIIISIAIISRNTVLKVAWALFHPCLYSSSVMPLTSGGSYWNLSLSLHIGYLVSKMKVPSSMAQSSCTAPIPNQLFGMLKENTLRSQRIVSSTGFSTQLCSYHHPTCIGVTVITVHLCGEVNGNPALSDWFWFPIFCHRQYYWHPACYRHGWEGHPQFSPEVQYWESGSCCSFK